MLLIFLIIFYIYFLLLFLFLLFIIVSYFSHFQHVTFCVFFKLYLSIRPYTLVFCSLTAHVWKMCVSHTCNNISFTLPLSHFTFTLGHHSHITSSHTCTGSISILLLHILYTFLLCLYTLYTYTLFHHVHIHIYSLYNIVFTTILPLLLLSKSLHAHPRHFRWRGVSLYIPLYTFLH